MTKRIKAMLLWKVLPRRTCWAIIVIATALPTTALAQQTEPQSPASQEAGQRTESPRERAGGPVAAERQPDAAPSSEDRTTLDQVTMSHRGEFVRAEENKFTMRFEGREHTHTLAADAVVTLDGEPATLSDLRPGDQLVVTAPKTELATAVSVRATRDGAAAQKTQDLSDQPTRDAESPTPARSQEPRQATAQGDTQRGALGVLLGESEDQGVAIQDVAPNSAAAQAGLRRGDLIVSIEGTEISSPQDILQAIGQKRSGEQIRMQIRRQDRTMNVNAVLGAQRDLAFRQSDQRPDDRRSQRQFENQQGQQSGQAWLGIMPRDDRQLERRQAEEDQPQDVQRRGAEIAHVYPSGPAARAGLRGGDVIIQIGEKEIVTLDDLYQAIDQLEPRQQVEITVLRGGEEQKLNVTLASRDDFFFGGPQQWRGFRGDQFGGFRDDFGEPFSDMPEHSIMLEQQRHLATQHQRLEDLLNTVLKEVKELRLEVQQLKGGEAPEPANP